MVHIPSEFCILVHHYEIALAGIEKRSKTKADGRADQSVQIQVLTRFRQYQLARKQLRVILVEFT